MEPVTSPMEPLPPPARQEIRIVDGDTVDIDGVRHRLAGFDAPERHQDCIDARGVSWECGDAATRKLEELIGSGPVTCNTTGQDRFGRSVSSCSAGGMDLGAALTRAGLALNDRRFSPDYSAEETEAHGAGAGMHAGRFIPPWSWRSGARLTPLNPSIIASDAIVYILGLPFRVESSCAVSACTISVSAQTFTIAAEDTLPERSERESEQLFSRRETLDDGSRIDAYGAWIEQSGFAVLTRTGSDGLGAKMAVSIADHFPATNPRELDGGATWLGAMAGIDSRNRSPLRGRSKLTIRNFSEPAVDILFTEIREIETSAARPDMTWNAVAIQGGAFSHGNQGDRISGRFYGDTHQEVGGVFERNLIVGGFAAKRGS